MEQPLAMADLSSYPLPYPPYGVSLGNTVCHGESVLSMVCESVNTEKPGGLGYLFGDAEAAKSRWEDESASWNIFGSVPILLLGSVIILVLFSVGALAWLFVKNSRIEASLENVSAVFIGEDGRRQFDGRFYKEPGGRRKRRIIWLIIGVNLVLACLCAIGLATHWIEGQRYGTSVQCSTASIVHLLDTGGIGQNEDWFFSGRIFAEETIIKMLNSTQVWPFYPDAYYAAIEISNLLTPTLGSLHQAADAMRSIEEPLKITSSLFSGFIVTFMAILIFTVASVMMVASMSRFGGPGCCSSGHNSYSKDRPQGIHGKRLKGSRITVSDTSEATPLPVDREWESVKKHRFFVDDGHCPFATLIALCVILFFFSFLGGVVVFLCSFYSRTAADVCALTHSVLRHGIAEDRKATTLVNTCLASGGDRRLLNALSVTDYLVYFQFLIKSFTNSPPSNATDDALDITEDSTILINKTLATMSSEDETEEIKAYVAAAPLDSLAPELYRGLWDCTALRSSADCWQQSMCSNFNALVRRSSIVIYVSALIHAIVAVTCGLTAIRIQQYRRNIELYNVYADRMKRFNKAEADRAAVIQKRLVPMKFELVPCVQETDYFAEHNNQTSGSEGWEDELSEELSFYEDEMYSDGEASDTL